MVGLFCFFKKEGGFERPLRKQSGGLFLGRGIVPLYRLVPKLADENKLPHCTVTTFPTRKRADAKHRLFFS